MPGHSLISGGLTYQHATLMSGSPTFYLDKRDIKGEFKTSPRPTGRQSN